MMSVEQARYVQSRVIVLLAKQIAPEDHLSVIESAIGQVLEEMSAERKLLRVPTDSEVEVESILQDMMSALGRWWRKS